MHKLVIPVRPCPQRDPWKGKSTMYIPERERQRQYVFEREIESQMKKQNIKKLLGCVGVFYVLRFAIRQSESLGSRKLMLAGKILRDKIPDRVNCEDYLENRIKDLLIEDDAKVVCGGSIKIWGEKDNCIIYARCVENVSDAMKFNMQAWEDIIQCELVKLS